MKHFYLFLVLLFQCIYIQYSSTNNAIDQLIANECRACYVDSSNDNSIFIPKNSLFFKQIFPASPDFIADILWFKAAYYFGLMDKTSKNYNVLPLLIDTITDLAPKWKLPYYFAAITFAFDANLMQDAFYFMKKGVQNIPDYWELWVLKGFCFWTIENDYVNAAKMMATASKIHDTPPYLAAFATTLALKTGKKEYGNQIAMEVIRHIKDKKTIQRILEKIN